MKCKFDLWGSRGFKGIEDAVETAWLLRDVCFANSHFFPGLVPMLVFARSLLLFSKLRQKKGENSNSFDTWCSLILVAIIYKGKGKKLEWAGFCVRNSKLLINQFKHKSINHFSPGFFFLKTCRNNKWKDGKINKTALRYILIMKVW